MSERRTELLEKTLEYLLEHGVADLSLRPLAESIGTSARLLIYHFGSKERLIAAAMEQVRLRFQASFAAPEPRRRKPLQVHPMMAFWKVQSRPANLPCLRLLLEVQVLALQNPSQWGPYLQQSSSSWLEVIEGAMPPSRRNRAMATLCAAVLDGLVLELLSTGDHTRVTAALERFIACLQQAPASVPPPQRNHPRTPRHD
ncbi:MAG TPA: TetR/AcrR family transcriptional regulator [Holophagaceae bacterium]|nr:TetR/AcrR family transcriptional regulator [Holophagaceae bacterium]